MQSWQLTQGALLLLIALAGAAIAYGQYRNAALKLQLDLFDRRYKIFEAARRMASTIHTTAALPVDDYLEFQAAIAGSNMLLGPEVASLLAELQARLAPLVKAGVTIPDTSPLRTADAQELARSIGSDVARVERAFRPYLTIPHRIGFR